MTFNIIYTVKRIGWYEILKYYYTVHRLFFAPRFFLQNTPHLPSLDDFGILKVQKGRRTVSLKPIKFMS